MTMIKKIIKYILSIDPTIVAAVIAAFVGLFTLRINKNRDIEIKQRNIKEEKYVDFLSSFVSFKGGYDTTKLLAETLQVIYLIGTSEVVNATKNFVELFDPNIYKDGPTEDEQYRRYSILLQAMRKDLYGEKINEGYPEKLKTILPDNVNQRINRQLIDKMVNQATSVNVEVKYNTESSNVNDQK